MFYKLRARNRVLFNSALFDAEINGLDPNNYNKLENTFEIGTGQIEKVSRLISKHKLDILVEKDFAPNELSYMIGVTNVHI